MADKIERDYLTFRLDVDVFRVLLLGQHLHTKDFRVVLDIVQHVAVLVSTKPFILPIETVGS